MFNLIFFLQTGVLLHQSTYSYSRLWRFSSIVVYYYYLSTVSKESVFALTVSSYQMAETCVPNMIAVKRAKRRPSKTRKMRRMMVAGGEKAGQERHSEPRQWRKWLTARNSAWMDMVAM